MEYIINQKEDVYIIDLKGEVDLYNAPKIDKKIHELINDNKLKIVIDLDGVTYIDSSGIGMLLSSMSTLKRKESSLKIINVGKEVRKVFHLAKLDDFFEIYKNEEEAIKSFSQLNTNQE